ncbi:hypothetical protein C6P40_004478 [Pichia californica]|uniref:Uncharacterized protein n=1 Tax=Pichia californica TaxID=460514 RepID=A0A9P6WGJ8_9ASCO|nr:hypothetical protein C6P42_002013 [[Candida] californica]KAG0686324.1 hypothetical protein C6P40_004478 [[Candida] californica]
MSIVVNNNVSLADKEEHVKVFDREHRVSVVEENCELPGLGLSKVISYKGDDEDEEQTEGEHDYYNNNYVFIPSVSCDNYDSVNVYGHNQM